jgi:glycine/D-amino acid oxidase-like deaminating enzyme
MNSGVPSTKSAVVIGAGMLGSSIAYHLSLRGVNVTIMDIKANILPDKPDDKIDPGTATSSSFAWLNANDKAPLSYMQLNILGMETWRRHELLKLYPTWSGSLIRRAKKDDQHVSTNIYSPHYSCIGPLSLGDASGLEPGIDWSSQLETTRENEIFFYPEEGHVNPAETVRALRLAAQSNNVFFKQGVQIRELVRDEGGTGNVIGIKYSDEVADDKYIEAGVVIVAAGSNNTTPLVGDAHIELKYEPGVIAYAKSPLAPLEEESTLQRIFVDTTSESHILRRSDGTLVIGGGQLIVGGAATVKESDKDTVETTDTNDTVGKEMLVKAAKSIKPFELVSLLNDDNTPVHITRANRPMPSDGMPVVGFIDSIPGLYVAVTHSGITLGPLIGELTAFEVFDCLVNEKHKHTQLQILDKYRPSRFKK